MFDDPKTYAPLKLFEYEHKPGTYALILSDADMDPVFDVFETNGRDARGYGFADLALQVIRTREPELEAKVDFDPEAGTFVAHGSDLESLKQLGALLHEVFHDSAKLGPLIAAAPYEYD